MMKLSNLLNFLFQFQYGAIGRMEAREISGKLESFNSSMVRLVEEGGLKNASIVCSFNSSMVRLVGDMKHN